MNPGKVRIPEVIFLCRQKMGSRWLKAHFVYLHQSRKAGFIATEEDRLVAMRVGQSRSSQLLGSKAVC